MKQFIIKDEFSKDSLIVFILSTLASAINYLCQIAMGRTMSLESFGVINAIFSYILVFSFPGMTYNLLAVKYIAEDSGNNNRVVTVISVMLRYFLITSAVVFIVSLVAKPLIMKVLGSDNFLIILCVTLVLCVGFLQPIYSGALSGMKLFLAVGFVGLILPLFKAVGVIGTAFTENEDSKIILVLLLMLGGYAVAAIAGHFFLKKNNIAFEFGQKVSNLNVNFGNVSFFTLACMLMYIIYYNFDILSINALFGSKESGLYSSAMLFGRIIFYFVTAFVTVMLPFVASEKAKSGAPELYLKKTILYTATIAVLFLLPINVAPKFFLGLVYGVKYLEASKYIPYVSVFSVLISLLNIAINYLVGIGSLRTLFITLFVGLVFGFVVIYFWHENFYQVLLCISTNLAVLVIINLRNCFYNDVKDAK